MFKSQLISSQEVNKMSLVIIIFFFIAAALIITGITILGISYLKKKSYIAGGIILFIFAAAIAAVFVSSGIFVQTGVSGNKFTYINHGTSSLGSFSEYYIDNHSMLTVEKELNYGSINRRFGHRFKAVESGECNIVVWEIDGAEIAYVDVYHIKADDKLRCTYEHIRSDLPKDINCYDRLVSVRYNGKELSQNQSSDFYNNLIALYGENIESEKPEESYPVMELEYCTDWQNPPSTAVRTYYIKDENSFYYSVIEPIRDENGKCIYDENNNCLTYEAWYEFRKDSSCKSSIIDVFEMSD
jgi:hypothetical protein